jgi:hypothetical protein
LKILQFLIAIGIEAKDVVVKPSLIKKVPFFFHSVQPLVN